MKGVYVGYSALGDRLYVGVACFGICGDSDGNGDDSVFAGFDIGEASVVRDYAHFNGTESFAVFMDMNLDGEFDIIVGIPVESSADCPSSDIDCIGVFEFNATNLNRPLSTRFGRRINMTVVVGCEPSKQCPHLEFSVLEWSRVPRFHSWPYGWRANVAVFGGSFEDGGIGEDWIGSMARPRTMTFLCPPYLAPAGA